MDVTALNRLFDGFLLAKEADGVKGTTLRMYQWTFRSLEEYLSTDRLQDARTITRFLPLTHLVALSRGLWFGKGWGIS